MSNQEGIKLTDHLLSLPLYIDMAEYCFWCESIVSDRIEEMVYEIKKNNCKEQWDEMRAEFQINLPFLIRKKYPTITYLQTACTCQIICDSVECDEKLDYLFASLSRAMRMRSGMPEAISDKLSLQITGVQLN